MEEDYQPGRKESRSKQTAQPRKIAAGGSFAYCQGTMVNGMIHLPAIAVLEEWI